MIHFRSGKRRLDPAGFTLVELLVVIAIIGVLVGLLLPAVQAARESGRRSSCVSRTKQIALAVLNYESVRKRLPSANFSADIQGTTNGGLASWIVVVLPFFEEQPLYDAVLARFKTGGAPWESDASSPFIRQPSGLLCPSDPNGRASNALTNGLGITNYRGNKGDMWGQWNCGVRGPFTDARVPGTFGTTAIGQYVRLKDITDGLSKTILLGEAVVGDLTTNVKSGMATNATIRPDTAPSACSSRAGGSGLTGSVATTVSQGSGHRWGDCRDVYVSLYTKIPPNGVSCSDTSPESTAAIAASSGHPGGANMALCDGSVRFYSESIDAGDQTATAPWPSSTIISYPSSYGVWGALGSIQGGEAKTSAE
jgi:prepilin-type N-terminal cleavage/methylation domain-containing protein/prepilin-type processing-associated H-X9-DG protein